LAAPENVREQSVTLRLAGLRGLQALVWLIFVLLPAWLRWQEMPALLPDLYASRHVLLVPMLAALGLWLVLGLPGWATLRTSRWRLAWAVSLLALAGWAALSTTWAYVGARRPDVGLTAAYQFAAVAGFTLVVACAGPRPRLIVYALLIGLAGLTALTLAQVAAGGAVGLNALGEFRFGAAWERGSVLQAGDLLFYRPSGLMPHPNMHAGLLMAGTLAAGALWFDRRRWLQSAGAVLAAAGLSALLLTFSRAALGGLAVGGIVALLLLWPRLKRREGWFGLALAAGLAGLAASAIFAAWAPFYSARALASEPVEMRSLADRIVFTDYALRAIGERPLQGAGAGNFPWRASAYLRDTFFDLRGDNVHNIYLSAAAELGLIGLGLMVIGLVSGGVAGARATRASPNAPDADRAALLGIVAALLAVGLLDHYPYTTFHFQALLWGCLAAAQVRRRL
jgi:hypothetical protein